MGGRVIFRPVVFFLPVLRENFVPPGLPPGLRGFFFKLNDGLGGADSGLGAGGATVGCGRLGSCGEGGDGGNEPRSGLGGTGSSGEGGVRASG